VFERIAGHPINRIAELLPWRLMQMEQPQPVQQAA
jgi:transposase